MDNDNIKPDTNEIEEVDENSVGRPKSDLDTDIIANLAAIGSTQVEIASVMGVSVRTLQRHHADLIERSKNKGNTSLRRAMYKNALEKNNPLMMIWLSKNALGMSDKVINENIENKPLPLIIDGENLTTVEEDK